MDIMNQLSCLVRASGVFALLAFTPLTCIHSQTPELARVAAAHNSLRQAQNEEDRLSLHEKLLPLWEEALQAGKIFQVDWTAWNHAVVVLGDGPDRVVVFTWNVELDDRTQKYGGWVAHASSESELGYEWTLLTHDPDLDTRDQNSMRRHDEWHGGLYYDGVITYDRQSPVYTLLAWDGADGLTNQKWIETMEPRKGRVRFGSPRFELPNGLSKRLVLTYADAVQVTLKVERSPVRIVMDHLAPTEASLKGQFAFYGPTLDYDALEWNKDRWLFIADVSVQNSSENSPDQYRDPSRRRRKN